MSVKSKWFWSLVSGVFLGIVLWSRDASADDNTLRINADEVRLRARPNEKAPTLMKLSDGQVVKLLERKGRWLKIQVRGKQGWIPRTYVDEDLRGDEEIVAAREASRDDRSRRSKTNLRRKDKGFDTLDDDARGEDGVSEKVSDGDDEEELDDETPEVLGAKKAKHTKAKKDRKSVVKGKSEELGGRRSKE